MIVVGVDDVPLGHSVEEEPPVVRVLGKCVPMWFSEDALAWLNEVNANRFASDMRTGGMTRSDTPSRDIAAPLTMEHVLDALAAASGMVPALAREAGLWLPAPMEMA